MKTDLLLHQVNRLIKLKVKLNTEFFSIHSLKKENIEKIERCDRMIKQLLLKNNSE